MTDIDALIEELFPPVTANDILRDLEALDFSFVIPPKARARAWKQRDVTRAFRAASRAGGGEDWPVQRGAAAGE